MDRSHRPLAGRRLVTQRLGEAHQTLALGLQLADDVRRVGEAMAQVGDLGVACGELDAQLLAFREGADALIALGPAGQPDRRLVVDAQVPPPRAWRAEILLDRSSVVVASASRTRSNSSS